MTTLTKEIKEIFDIPNSKNEDPRLYHLNYMKWYNNEKIHCDLCKKSVIRGSIRRHEKSLSHKERATASKKNSMLKEV